MPESRLSRTPSYLILVLLPPLLLPLVRKLLLESLEREGGAGIRKGLKRP
jgi:hypothetical protein